MVTQELITTENYEISGDTFTVNLDRVNNLQKTIRKLFVENKDFGQIKGCGDKPTLLKPGAEKILMTFGLQSDYEILDMQQDFKGNGFFSYVIKCNLYHNGIKILCGLGSCNSNEDKFRYKWLYKNELPESIDISSLYSRKTKSGYIQYRVEDNACSKSNTILKMAKKRALVDAALTVAGLSELFTQDFDDDDMPESPEDKMEEIKKQAPKEVKTVKSLVCSHCKTSINKTVYDFSMSKYEKPLCINCQRKVTAGVPPKQ